MRPTRGIGCVLVLGVAGCAARSSPQPAEPARAPSSTQYASPPAAAAPTSSPPASTTPGAGGADKAEKKLDRADKDAGSNDALSRAIAELDLSARSVELSLSSCDVACRALGSMERAARHVCDVTDDRLRCEDATRRLREARSRVRAACGDCHGVPTTDPDAPVR